MVPGTKTRCGRCVYFRHAHPKWKSDCKDVFQVEKSTQACIDFELVIDPEHYKKHPDIRKYLELAEQFEMVVLLQEEVRSLSGRVFQKSQVRAGETKVLHPVRAVLRKENDTTALVAFFEQVQNIRDRVSEILSLTIASQGRLELILQPAESFLYTRFPEVKALKPEAVRISTVRAILSELHAAKTNLSTLHSQCEWAIKNSQAEHQALVEIQISTRSPVSMPHSRILSGESDELPRGDKRYGRK